MPSTLLFKDLEEREIFHDKLNSILESWHGHKDGTYLDKLEWITKRFELDHVSLIYLRDWVEEADWDNLDDDGYSRPETQGSRDKKRLRD